jgi:hypothetical protein
MAISRPLFDRNTGQHVGWETPFTDGAIVETDLHGAVVGAFDPDTGEALEEEPYAEDAYEQTVEAYREYEQAAIEQAAAEEEAFEGYTDEELRAAEMLARQEAAEERLNAIEQQRAIAVEPAGPTTEQKHAAWEQQLDHIQRMRGGTPLTMSEAAPLLVESDTVSEYTGAAPDLVQAYVHMADEERDPLYDLDTHQGRVDYWQQRMREQDGTADDPLSGQPARLLEEYHYERDRVQLAMDRAAGYDVEGRVFGQPDSEEMI